MAAVRERVPGEGVRALATVTPSSREGRQLGAKVVVARQGHMLASAFHPELTGDPRLHHLFLRMVTEHVAKP